MKTLIYGAGAVGLGIASFLLKADADIDIIARQSTAKSLSILGLVRTGIFGDYVASPNQFNAYHDLESLGNKHYDYILICAKTYDIESICKNIFSSNLSNLTTSKIILFNNGWKTHEIASQFTNHVYNARIITGFIRTKPNQVDITVHADTIHIGNISTNDPSAVIPISELINSGGIPCKTVTDIAADLWAKMLYNCALNPVGAILEVPYGKLGEHPGTRSIMEGIIQEVFEVMTAMGYHIHWDNADDYIETFYSTLLPATYAHKSSMLQDIKAGKRTEIDFLNGVIVENAKQLNKNANTNKMITELIKSKEQI